MLSLNQAAVPQAVAGLLGRSELDLQQPVALVAFLQLSSVGNSRAFLSMPANPILVGIEFWMQGLVLPAGALPGLTNAVREVVLP